LRVDRDGPAVPVTLATAAFIDDFCGVTDGEGRPRTFGSAEVLALPKRVNVAAELTGRLRLIGRAVRS
jgi:hypothetical protein